MPRTTIIARKPPAEPAETAAKTRRRPAVAGVKMAATPGTPRKKAAAAGPKRRTSAPNAVTETETQALDRLQALISASLDDDKAENIVAIDLAGRAAFTDRMVIATGLADRQITAMAQHLDKKLHEAGIKRVQIEGSGTDWVLIDSGDIVIHLFKPDAREMYGLEKMWGAELDEAAPAADMGVSVVEPE